MWRRWRDRIWRTTRAARPTKRLGDRGERLAVAYLKGRGYRIVATNLRVPVGHALSGRAVVGEVDVVAYDGATLAFVEVKTRRREGLYPTERAVGARKQRLLASAARRYRRFVGVSSEPYRFDVVTVLLPEGGPPVVRLVKGYFAPHSAPRP